ncbi:MAG: hypothetical protein BTN85_0008 [Candidatus Methanohalarchaeum thermophilum]|uniref:Uncharacterized protein n=1 Tax=Methanohalarchaeum thermophilum TaxID=1903181 RepID=A0A1Q6DT91_METT1|nr:MAG: hypothetical protein BTN85_0008 [Candidatus Methanohalarchaeum thermophilum]
MLYSNLIEMANHGLLEQVEYEIDKEGKFQKEAILHKYCLTETGEQRAKDVGALDGKEKPTKEEK